MVRAGKVRVQRVSPAVTVALLGVARPQSTGGVLASSVVLAVGARCAVALPSAAFAKASFPAEVLLRIGKLAVSRGKRETRVRFHKAPGRFFRAVAEVPRRLVTVVIRDTRVA